MFEVRTDNNPQALPLGDSTVSRHRTPQSAWNSIDKEIFRFRVSPYATDGAYLARIVVEVDSDGTERIISRFDIWDRS